MAKTVRELSDKAKEILAVLETNSGKELTIADLKELGVESPNGSQLSALETRGLITSREVERVVPKIVKVKAYQIIETKTE